MRDGQADAEAVEYRKFRESIKSEFCKFAESLSEDALAGKTIAMVAIMMSQDGNLSAVHLGMRPTEGIGMLEAGKEILKTILFAGGLERTIDRREGE